MLELRDKNKRKIALLDKCKDICVESILESGDKTLSFLYPSDANFNEDIVEETYIRTKHDEFIVKTKVKVDEYDSYVCKLNVEELTGNFIDRFDSREQLLLNALNLVVVGTGWTVNVDNYTKKIKRTIRKTATNSWNILKDVKKVYGVDIRYDTLNKVIFVYDRLGSDKGTYFIDSLNLKALQVQSNSYDFYTRIVPQGKDGLTIASVNGGVAYLENKQYSSKTLTYFWKDERYTNPESLKEDALRKLNSMCVPYRSYTALVLNLAKLNKKYKDILDYNLGDIVTLISKNKRVREKQRIVKTKEYLQDHSKDTVELANKTLNLDDAKLKVDEIGDTLNNITTDNGTVDGSTIDSITTKQIEDFKANVIEVVNLKAINASIDNLHAIKADIQDLNAVNARIGTLEATKANITQLNAVNAEISKLNVIKANVTDLKVANGKISVLESKTASIDNLVSQKANINDLKALNATISNALIKKATIAQLEALETKTNKLIADKANISDLDATNATINSIQAETANIKTLLNGNLSSENIQAGGITSDKLTIANGFITNLMISSVGASKITAGTIDAAKINVVNLNADNLTVGKINGQLLKDGSISGLAIENGAIDNNKVSPNANIEASKININSVVTAINKGSTLLTANKVSIDSEKGTLDVAFNKLNTSLEANKKATESNLTAINVVQGKLSSSIENSKVLEGKQKTLEDNYNRTVATVDALKNTVGSQKTLIDSATGKITSVEVKANTLEKNLSGLTQTVTDTKKVIENNKTVLESKNAELKANIDKVSSSLSSVSSTVDKNNKTLVAKTNTLEQNLNGLSQTVANNKTVVDGKITSVEGETHELKAGLGGLTSKLDTLKSTTDGINKTVSNQGSAINQLKDSIKLKVDSSTFTESTQTINSSINKAKEDAINTANSNTTNAINNIKIGTRNYGLNTNVMQQEPYSIIFSKDFKFERGKQYSLSLEFDVENLVAGSQDRVGCETSIGFKDGSRFYIGIWHYIRQGRSFKGRKSYTFTIPDKEIVDNPKGIHIYTELVSDGKRLLGRFKLEDGTKATTYTEAPEDLKKYSDDVAIAKSELSKEQSKAYADGIVTEEERSRIAEAKKNLDTAIAKATEAESKAKSYADVKKQEAINTANADATNKANSALNNAKAYTNTEITTVNSHLNKATAEINVLKKQIEFKVGQSDIDKSIEDVKFGDRNLFPEIYLGSHGCTIRKLENFYMNIPTYNIVVNRPNQGNNFGFNIKRPIKINGGKGVTFTFLFNYIINKFINNHSSNMHGYTRVYYKDGSKQDFDFNSKIIDCKNKSNWGKWISLKFTFTTDSNKEIDNIGLFYFYTDGASEGTDFNFTIPKLVIGNKIGDWTPATEDTDQLIIDNIKTVTDKISTVESKLTQENNSIKASVQDLNSTTQSITTNVSNINRDLTSKINSNLDVAKKFATDIAIARADKAKQDAINTASTDATNKANNALNSAKAFVNAEITTVNNKVHNVESNLNILSDRINSKVSQSDIDKSIKEIKIGCRNLVVNSDVLQNLFSPLGGYAGTREVINDEYALCKKDVLFKCTHAGTGFHLPLFTKSSNKIGKTYTWSFWAKCSVNKKGTIGHESNGQTQVEFTTQWKKFSHTWLFGDCTYSSFTFYIGWNVGEILYIRDFKIEEGTKATDWTPAPEDTDKLIVDSIKVVDSKISDVSSSVTQLRDSVTTDIRAINSKTNSIETSLNGKASKQEVTEVNNRVATIKASLDGITQRVSSTESKTRTLESNLNCKASKQEVNNVSSKVVSLEANLNGITNRVSSTESRINTLNGQVANAVTKQQFTEFKQSDDKFKFTVEQRSSVSNILPNSSFYGGDRGWLHNGAEFWSGPYSGYGFKGRMTGAIKNRTSYNNPERFLQTHKAYKVKKNTTYTISFHYACEMNIHSMEAYIVLSDTEHGDYAQPIRILEKPGGTQSDPNNEIPFTYKFNTGNHEWVWLRFDHNGMKPGTNWDQYCWLYVSEIGIYEGDVGAVKWTPKGGEVYSSNYQMDGLGFKGTFEDGTYAYLGKEGFEWYNAGTGHSYHALTYVTSFDIPIGNPGKAYIKLPAEFTKRKSSLKWTVALRGYYYSTSGNFFPFHVHCTGARDYIENGLVVCEVQGLCKIQNANNSGDVQFRPLTAMLIAIA